MMKRMLLGMAALLVPPFVLAQQPVWTGSWGAAPVAMKEQPAAELPEGATFRDVVRLSIGGKAVRLRLSNESGTAPLMIGGVHVALSNGPGSGAIRRESDHTVLFAGKESVEIPAGSIALSDPLAMPVAPLADLAVSIYVPHREAASMLTGHVFAASTNFVAPGNMVGAQDFGSAKHLKSWYLLSGVDVDAGAAAKALVILGASISEGVHSTPDKNARWSNTLSVRLGKNAATRNVGIVNEGISGNRLLHDVTDQSAMARLDRDVLSQSNAKYVIVMLGNNDIGRTFFPQRPGEAVTADEMIWALTQIAQRAHDRGFRVIGTTLTPFAGAGYYNEDGEKMRQAVNTFARTGKGFDGLIDFDAVVRDPAQPGRLRPEFDSGDHLHPNDEGYRAMGEAVDLKLFTR